MENDLLWVGLVVVLFALLAYDLGANDAAWSSAAVSFADDFFYQIKHLGSR